MNISLAFMRVLFTILSVFFAITFLISYPGLSLLSDTILGVLSGCFFTVCLIAFDRLFKRFNLRAFNITVIGLFVGYLMGQAIVLIFDAIINISSLSILIQPRIIELIKIGLFLFGTYLGAIMTLRSSDEFYISIPFVKFSQTAQKKKDLILDTSALSDVRIIDLCSTGILNHQLILPRFVIKDFYSTLETKDEGAKDRARRALEVVKKMEETDTLGLRFNDTDFPEVKDTNSKSLRLARLIGANILTADLDKLQSSSSEGTAMINIHSLSSALKPLLEKGERIKIKIQRYGKEPRQGIGYLEDGTMVVVNGGGNYIGELIEVQVLSVKHTSSGRMIFCNSNDEISGSDSLSGLPNNEKLKDTDEIDE